MYSPHHRQIGTPIKNFWPTLRIAPDFCKNVSLTGLFCQAKEIKNGTAVNGVCQGTLSVCRMFSSPTLYFLIH
jgi:hypothetical protein